MLKTFKLMFFWTALQVSTLLVMAPVWAQNNDGLDPTPEQLQRMMAAQAEEMQSTILMVQLGVMVAMMIGLGTILLVARRNMRGWNQPIKWVWFSFQGRLNRKAYWLKGQVPLVLINLGLQTFLALLGLVLTSGTGGAVLGGVTALVVLLPFMIFSMWAGLAISAKRFHDLGSSAWWILGFLIPFYNLWLGIKVLFFRGTPGPNDFGPDPIDEIEAYIDEMTGAGEEPEDSDDEAEPVQHPQPHAPEAPTEPQGFGARKFGFKPQADDADTVREPEFVPEDLPGGDANLDVIKRRLGDDIMRPIKRKGGGGRPAES